MGNPISPNTWYLRNCNGKAYMVDKVHEMFGTEMIWLYEEGCNRMLHIPVKRFRRTFTKHAE